MVQKHLHELLQEDQEPFQLKNYIADRRCQLKKASSSSSSSQKTQQILVKKRKPISQTTKFPSNFCKNACFFSFRDSPEDPIKSPLFEFLSPAKSPCRNTPNAIFLQIPARTSVLLLEAALRIQKQSSKQKIQNKKEGSTLFGSIRRKLTHRNRTRKREDSSSDGVKITVKNILRWDSSVGSRKSCCDQKHEQEKEQQVGLEEKSAYELGFPCSCNGRLSSAGWSERNEDKSLDLDLETSCSSQSEYFEEEMEETDFASFEKRFCESPFRFVPQTNPSPGRRTLDFSSAATSPMRHKKEDKQTPELEMTKKFQLESEDEVEEKEQCSPVSVLDPPFEEDDEEGHEGEDDDKDEYDLECSYASVQRSKHQLLHKLCRFEKLAVLDPVELEIRVLEQEQDDNENVGCDHHLEEEEECEYYHESATSDRENDVDKFVKEVLSKSSLHHARQIPRHMKRLVEDLIAEEERERNWCVDRDIVVKRVCRSLELWKEVESNTIDMMVELDLRRELDGWKRYYEQVAETALEIEFDILGLLVEELSKELSLI